jgi:DNA polymerase-1
MTTKIDFHTEKAAELFKVPIEKVTPEMRRKAKAVNYGLAYGMTDEDVAELIKKDQS